MCTWKLAPGTGTRVYVRMLAKYTNRGPSSNIAARPSMYSAAISSVPSDIVATCSALAGTTLASGPSGSKSCNRRMFG